MNEEGYYDPPEEKRFDLNGRERIREEINAMVRMTYYLKSIVETAYMKGERSRRFEDLMTVYNDLYTRTHHHLEKELGGETGVSKIQYSDTPETAIKYVEKYNHLLETHMGYHSSKPEKKVRGYG